MQNPSTRRQFLATASAGAALAFTATSYAKIVGANERISHRPDRLRRTRLRRPTWTASIPRQAAERRVHRRERSLAASPRASRGAMPGVVRPPGPAVRLVSRHPGPGRHRRRDDRLAATTSTAAHLEAAAKAKKDAYCEKPLAMDMASLNRVRRRGQGQRGIVVADGHAGAQLLDQHRLPGAVPLRGHRQGLAHRAVPQRQQALLVLVDAAGGADPGRGRGLEGVPHGPAHAALRRQAADRLVRLSANSPTARSPTWAATSSICTTTSSARRCR